MRPKGAHRRLPPADTPIWRYFDFSKLLSLLDTQSLFFPSADSLEDPLEGVIPWPSTDRWPQAEDPWESPGRSRRDLVMISSWHANPDESIAMWKLYSRSTEAVAIRSTVGRLRTSLGREKRFEILLGQVNYIDSRQEGLDAEDPLAPFLFKARPYAYENEIRAIIDLRGRPRGDALARRAEEERGVHAQVDVSELIEAICISPFAGRWFLDLVASVLRRFGCSIEATRSVLTETPRSA